MPPVPSQPISRGLTTAVAGTTLLLLAACAAVTSKKNSDGGEGIPYSLPQGRVVITVSGTPPSEAAPGAFHIDATTQLVPDRNQTYLLNPSKNWFGTDDLKLSLDEGMLSSINSNNVGKLDEFVSNVTATVLNVQTIGTGLTEMSPNANLYLTSPSPTPKPDTSPTAPRYDDLKKRYPEALAMLESKLESQELASIKAELEKAKCEDIREPASTKAERAQLLKVLDGTPVELSAYPRQSTEESAAIRSLPNYQVTAEWEQLTVAEDKPPKGEEAAVPDEKGGIYVSVITPHPIDVAISGSAQKILCDRIRGVAAALAEIMEETAQLDKKIALLNASETILNNNQLVTFDKLRELLKPTDDQLLKYGSEWRKWEKHLQDAATAREKIAAAKSEAQEELDKLKDERAETVANVTPNLLQLWKARENSKITVFEHTVVVSIPDVKPVLIPMKDALIGKTVHTLKLNKGVLVDYSIERPSSAVEFSKIPLNLSQAVITQITSLVQFKIDLQGKQKELLDKQKATLAAQNELKDQIANLGSRSQAGEAARITAEYEQMTALLKTQNETAETIDSLGKKLGELQALLANPENTEYEKIALQSQIARLKRQIEVNEQWMKSMEDRIRSLQIHTSKTTATSVTELFTDA